MAGKYHPFELAYSSQEFQQILFLSPINSLCKLGTLLQRWWTGWWPEGRQSLVPGIVVGSSPRAMAGSPLEFKSAIFLTAQHYLHKVIYEVTYKCTIALINYSIITINNLEYHMQEALWSHRDVVVDSSMAADSSVESHWGTMEQLGLQNRQVDRLGAYKTFWQTLAGEVVTLRVNVTGKTPGKHFVINKWSFSIFSVLQTECHVSKTKTFS